MKPWAKLLIGIAFLLAAGGALFFSATGGQAPSAATPVATASKEKTQSVHIRVNHGYSPHLSFARGGEPLRLEIETKDTYDCTSSIYIPALHFRKFLPATGVTSIDIPPQEKGSTLTVLCAMGMYSFDIQFE